MVEGIVRRLLLFAAVGIGLFLLVGLGLFARRGQGRNGLEENPRAHLRVRRPHTDHAALLHGPFADGPAVTRACLHCHPAAAREVMATSHWTWLGQEVKVAGHPGLQRIGKADLLNNFCIGVQPNLAHCTECHAGYGWVDRSFDFANPERVDCLVCHESTGTYQKAPEGGGNVAEGVDLVAVARSVGLPTRRNCGFCHFAGGGGDAVKHGDLDGTMYFPSERIDVHMGKLNFDCQECHRTVRHDIAGRSMSVSVEDANRVACTDCHSPAPHRDERLNGHTKTVACQSCHIPKMAVEAATKMSWDWSTAGRDPPPGTDPHLYSKTKGTFTFARDVPPEYFWYNGTADRYLLGDKIDPEKVTRINYPRGSAADAAARIWPFKVHRGKQPYDVVHRYLLVPKTSGPGGFWQDFDWDKALRLGEGPSGLAYSGRYGFAATAMYWPLSHMVAARDKALQCVDCHGPGGRLHWSELGYDGDPAFRGGREGTLASGSWGSAFRRLGSEDRRQAELQPPLAVGKEVRP
jgi:octaheme c-type cytochrome (tetrathionate reductase family)